MEEKGVNLRKIILLSMDQKAMIRQLQEWVMVPKCGEFKCSACGAEMILEKDSSRYGFR